MYLDGEQGRAPQASAAEAATSLDDVLAPASAACDELRGLSTMTIGSAGHRPVLLLVGV